MKLHQLLRFIKSGCFIIIFNVMGGELVRVRTKESLNVDLMEIDVQDVTVGWKDLKNKESALFITLSI